MLDQRRVHLRLFGSCSVVVTIGLVISVLVWGTSTFRPLKFAATRDSAGSIFAFLRGDSSPLWLVWDAPSRLAGSALLINGRVRDIRVMRISPDFARALGRSGSPCNPAVLSVCSRPLSDGALLPRLVLGTLRMGQLKKHTFLTTLLVSYFGWFALKISRFGTTTM
jgi:hypothetical protein